MYRIIFAYLWVMGRGIMGICAIRRAKREGRSLHGMGRAVFGIVMGMLVLVFWAFVIISVMSDEWLPDQK